MNPDSLVKNAPPWWNGRALHVACVVIAMLPLIYPTIPPLVDLPGHMGRYAVQLDHAPFRDWYSFRWQLIGNLGVDLLIEPMSRLFGIELGTKLIVLAIPALAVAGLLAIAREVHGRVPPTAFFALPLVWGHPFVFGFVNFALAMALALLGFALWLRMGRTGYARLRPIVFLPVACVIWTAHTFGWGLLGLLCFSAELIRQRDGGKSWLAAGIASVLACLPMALPLIPMLVWRSGLPSGQTGDMFNWVAKSLWILMTLRDRWQAFDVAALCVIVGVIVLAVRDPRFGFSRNLAVSALILVAVYLLLPRIIFGSAYADMRLVPYVFAVAIIAVRPKESMSPRALAIIAMLGLAFFAARIAAHTISFAIASARYDRALGALEVLPKGARVAAFTERKCNSWSTNRMEHLAGIAMVRRAAFSNDQWSIAGAQLMRITRPEARYFAADPSQLVVERPCGGDAPWLSLDKSLRTLPRAAFDYVWLIDPPHYDTQLTAGMTQVWESGPDRLYRIDRVPRSGTP